MLVWFIFMFESIAIKNQLIKTCLNEDQRNAETLLLAVFDDVDRFKVIFLTLYGVIQRLVGIQFSPQNVS